MAPDTKLLDRVRAARRRLADDGPVEARSADDFTTVTLPTSDADVLRDLLIAEEAEVVIEVGLAYGTSALAIGEALVTVASLGGRHVVVDAFQDQFFDAGWRAVIDAGLTDICELRRERSQLALAALVADGFLADAAFVDGSHLFHNVFVDLTFLRELVRPGGLLVLDDVDWRSVATAVHYFEVNAGWRRESMVVPTRLRAYRLPDPPPEPRFEEFEPFGLEPRR